MIKKKGGGKDSISENWFRNCTCNFWKDARKISQNIFDLTEKFSPGDRVTFSQHDSYMYDRLKDTDKKKITS